MRHNIFFTMCFLSIFTWLSIANIYSQTVVFKDNFNQTPVNPIDTSGQPTVKYNIWTTVTPPNELGGTALIEEYDSEDRLIKLLAANDASQSGNRIEVSAPLSVYKAPFTPKLNANGKDLEWTFTLKQNRNSAGGSSGFNGSYTGLAVVLAADLPTWGSQQGSKAKGYAVTFFKPNGKMYCASISRFNGGLSNSTVIVGNKLEDIFSEFKTWVTVKVTYSPEYNEWSLFFRDEHSTSVKGDINDSNGLKLIGSTVDSTFTNVDMSYFGFALNTPKPSVSANHNAMFVDDFSVRAVENSTERFAINLTNSEGGSVDASPKMIEYPFGSEVTLTAVPQEGYIFKSWTGDVKSYGNPVTVVVNSEMNVEANFIKKPQDIENPKPFIHYNSILLEAVKSEISSNNAFFLTPYNNLIKKANEEMKKAANPVTNKTIVPPSGNKHDYISIGPYWWPDTSKPDGLPWINKDGKVNPATRGYDVDFVRTKEFIDAIESLSFAYYFSDNYQYAFKAIDLLNIWLVDDSTKMNPNAKYAQGVPGRNDGSKHGIIEFTGLYSVIVALQILENKGIIPDHTKEGVNNWLSDYKNWLRTSTNGIGARDAGNNHGTWYDFQLLGLMLYEGDTVGAIKLANDFKSKRIASQIDTQGKQPHELARTKSVNYSTMNLWAMTWLASMAEQVGVDLWNYQTSDGRGIQKAYSFLKPYVLKPSTWRWQQITNGGAENALNTLTQPLFAKASTIFDQDLISQSENAGNNMLDLEKLQFPPREQLFVGEEGKAYAIINIDNRLGSASVSPDSVNYVPGAVLELSAQGKSGYLFSNWSGGINSDENPISLKLDSTIRINANFVRGLTLTISEETTNGTVEIDPKKDLYAPGDTVTLTPHAADGYIFDSWRAIGISGNVFPRVIVINRNLEITANFTPVNSIHEKHANLIDIYPNPSENVFNIKIQEPSAYKVYALNGLLIEEGYANKSFELDLRKYGRALYILQVESKGVKSMFKLIQN